VQLGALSDLGWLPPMPLDGFLVAPASWRIPPELDRRRFARWRRAAGVGRWVQVGLEDELLPVDLDDARQVTALLRRAPVARPRAYEVWPPLDRLPDRAGRRVELVASVVDVPEARAPSRRLGAVPPPRRRPAEPAWQTYKLFGAPDRADLLLVALVAPTVRAALADGRLEGWFFLRYVDGPGRRHHLRLRVRADGVGHAAFDAALREALVPAREAGDLVLVETAPYHPEIGRYGAEAMGPLERLWEADSELACDLLDGDGELPELLVRAFDALAAALGLDAAGRAACAAACTLAYAADLAALRDTSRDAPAVRRPPEPFAAEYRARQARLRQVLEEPPPASLSAFSARVRRAAAPLDQARRAALLPSLIHLSAVRLAGTRRIEELRALSLWQRAAAGVLARARRRPAG
jgi:thiopeptide-type bacteriocin biosynthesis protein